MATIGRLNAILTANTAQFDRALGKSEARMRKFGEVGKANALSFARLGVASLKYLGIAGGSYGLGMYVKNTISAIDAQQKFADLIGTTAKDLAGLRLAAKLTGSSEQALEMSLQRMTRRLGEASKGSGEAVKALDALGLNAKDLIKNSPAAQFKAIADAISKVSNRAQKVAIVQKLFDSEGVALLRTLDLGSKGLDKMQRQAEKFGLAFDENVGRAAEHFDDAVTRIIARLKGASYNAFAATVNAKQGYQKNALEFFNNIAVWGQGNMWKGAGNAATAGLYGMTHLSAQPEMEAQTLALKPLPIVQSAVDARHRRDSEMLQEIANNTKQMRQVVGQ